MRKAGRVAAGYRAYREVTKPGSPGVMTRVRAIPRMIGRTARGHYKGLSKTKLAMMAAGVLYILSPVDIVPDFLVPFGVVDDFGAFLWLMTSLLSESGEYAEWERREIVGTAEPVGPGR